MKRPVFSFRPNLKNPEHQKAWTYLEEIPSGQRNAYLVQAILRFEEMGYLEKTIRAIIQEEMKGIKMSSVLKSEENKEMPEPFLDFISRLQEE